MWRSLLLWLSPHQIMYLVDVIQIGSVRVVDVPFTVSCLVLSCSILVCDLFLVVLCVCVCFVSFSVLYDMIFYVFLIFFLSFCVLSIKRKKKKKSFTYH